MGRNKYPEETRARILDVAQKLILEKGYEATSIQDIVDGLGGMTKGAVYHHFSSKEDIFDAVGDRYNAQIIGSLQAVRDDPKLTGYEKLRKMFEISLASGNQDIVYTVAPNMLDNPKLLASQMKEIFELTSPAYIQPIIEQGMRDGSIQTDYPQELSEVILLLTNIWLNPLVIRTDVDSMERKVSFFGDLLKNIGVDLLDDNMRAAYRRYCLLVQQTKG